MGYIDAELLKFKIQNRIEELDEQIVDISDSKAALRSRELLSVLDLIDSLQQEQPEVPNGKFVFPKYLYARTKDNKTIDISYAPQDMTAVEYIRSDSLKQEVSDNVDKLKSISTPAEEDWFKISKKWEKEDEQPVTDCNELKEAARKYARKIEDVNPASEAWDFEGAFRAGAEWQKAKMMEGSVEGVVCYGSKGAYIETDFLGEYDTDVYGNPGDKVKIIIVKEDKR